MRPNCGIPSIRSVGVWSKCGRESLGDYSNALNVLLGSWLYGTVDWFSHEVGGKNCGVEPVDCFAYGRFGRLLVAFGGHFGIAAKGCVCFAHRMDSLCFASIDHFRRNFIKRIVAPRCSVFVWSRSEFGRGAVLSRLSFRAIR